MKEEAQIEQKYVNIRKVNILGITGSGKSTLVSLLQESEYQSLNPENPEDNVDMIKQVLKANITFKNGTSHFLNIVVASLDEMSVSTKTLLYDTDLIIVIIDITSMDSFIRIKAFLESLTDIKDYKIILVTNKIDLDSNREISGFEIKQFKDEGYQFYYFVPDLLSKEKIKLSMKCSLTMKNIILFKCFTSKNLYPLYLIKEIQIPYINH